MDVVFKPRKRNISSLFSRKIFLVSLALSILGVTYFLKNHSHSMIKREGLIVSKVLHGDFYITVDAYGIVESNERQLISARSRSTVKQILARPGDKVKEGDLLVVLENPELLQRVKTVELEVSEVEGELKQLVLNNMREALLDESIVAEISSEYDFAILQREAEEKLVGEGVVSKMAFKRSVLTVKQLERHLNILNRRVEQLKDVQQAQVKILEERVLQRNNALAFEMDLLEKLNIKSTADGILLRLPVEVGQSVDAGQEIGVIGGANNLIASLRIPQNLAHFIKVGQTVSVNTLNSKTDGSVLRIHPEIDNNTVVIETSLNPIVGLELRPQQNVDASIVIKKLENVKYIENIQNIRENQSIDIFKLNDSEDKATLQTVRFGEKSGRFIRILSGASVGEKLITSNVETSYNEIFIQ